ncbi:MAG: beta-hydroxyacyl-ACP dehydratase [Chitinivibrionales bacterium]|nr:beta-hydroxyacyl-ACP dehydratase [Chitinivibrionales bacterium]
MTHAILYDRQSISTLLSHRPPFLFVDQVTALVENTMIETQWFVLPHEFFFPGHFPGHPIVPGVIVTDALAQTSGLLLALSTTETGQICEGNISASEKCKETVDHELPEYVLAAITMKFHHPAGPNQCITMRSYKGKKYGPFSIFSVEANVNRKIIAKGSITLSANPKTSLFL